MMKYALALSLLGLLLLAGCLSYKADKGQEGIQPSQQVEEPALEEVENLSSDIDDLSTIEEDLNTSALDEIDFDLGI